ncbi:hypothetical protein JL107_09130 [Nakamurella flavida]|uniref:histidine kinase n=1 Tax=Nakamurella flavida TaxID=363630 RepID=A0A938YP27_9ACTN|nr:histidine kinase [Nakamurella flavida]MBM9476603.1 hypothetical protein [Nakamurella flavida]MDP9778959.1 signal transduction histidine kinase [Nakamurella flavida]
MSSGPGGIPGTRAVRAVPAPEAGRSRPPRSDLVGSLHRALLFLATGLLTGSGLLLAVMIDEAVQPAWWLTVYFATCVLWTVTGIFAWWRRPSNGMGALLVWGGLGLVLAGAGTSTVPGIATIGAVFATAPLAVLVHLVHAFPSGRVRGRFSILTVAGGYVVTYLLQVPLYAFDPQFAALPLFVADRPDLLRTLSGVQSLAGTLVMIGTTIVLAGRLRRARPFQRRVLIPLFGYGILAVLWVPLSANVLGPWLDLPFAVVVSSQLIVLAGVPIAFALAVFRGGFARTGELQELSGWIGAREESRSGLDRALASVLGDPTLELAFWVPEERLYVDADGRPVTLPVATASRRWVEIELSGEAVGAIVYDGDLLDDPDRVRAAGRVVALGVDRERLTAALRVTEQSLRRSRERIVETADRERRRIAQDLHDGLQVKLVLLALEAQQLANTMDPGAPVRDEVTDLRLGIDAAAAELRALVHAVMPSALVERGLAMATEDLLDRLPMRSTLHVDGVRRLPLPVQSTAYFVVAEAVANVVKHAGARTVSVRVQEENGTLTIDVQDDGVGGASMDRGTGIRGLLDRVDVLGGRLELTSPLRAGTRLSVTLPVSQAGPDPEPRPEAPGRPDRVTVGPTAGDPGP